MESITLLNKTILVMCTYEDEKEKKERLKVCVEKLEGSQLIKLTRITKEK